MLKLNQDADKKIRAIALKRLSAAVSIGAEESKRIVAVDTARLQNSIRVSEPVEDKDGVSVSLLAGGGEVDYAYEQELRSPFLRPVAPVIREAMRGEL